MHLCCLFTLKAVFVCLCVAAVLIQALFPSAYHAVELLSFSIGFHVFPTFLKSEFITVCAVTLFIIFLKVSPEFAYTTNA